MPIGMISSPLHIATNKRIEDKKHCMLDVAKQQIKDFALYTGAVATVGAASGAAAKYTPKGAEMVSKIQNAAEKFVRRFKFDNKSLMRKLEGTKIYKSFNALPVQAKAAIGGTVAAAAVLLPVYMHHTYAKGAEIEGRYETK